MFICTITLCVRAQLRMRSGKQNRILVESKFDGRGVSSETDNQLGRYSMGKTAVRAVDNSVWASDFRALRIITSDLHRLQGKFSF